MWLRSGGETCDMFGLDSPTRDNELETGRGCEDVTVVMAV